VLNPRGSIFSLVKSKQRRRLRLFVFVAPIGRSLVFLCVNQNEHDLHWFIAFVSPGVPRSILNNNVMRFEMYLLSVVDFKPHSGVCFATAPTLTNTPTA
jgi:hypothetical protein